MEKDEQEGKIFGYISCLRNIMVIMKCTNCIVELFSFYRIQE